MTKTGFRSEKEYQAVLEAVKEALKDGFLDYYDNLEYFAVRLERNYITVYMDNFVVAIDPDGGHIVEYKVPGEKPILMGTDIFRAVSTLGQNAKMVYKTLWEYE